MLMTPFFPKMCFLINFSTFPALLPIVQCKFSFSPIVQCRPKVQFEQWPQLRAPGWQMMDNYTPGSPDISQSEAQLTALWPIRGLCQSTQWHDDGQWFSTNIGATELFYSNFVFTQYLGEMDKYKMNGKIYWVYKNQSSAAFPGEHQWEPGIEWHSECDQGDNGG